MQRTYGAFSVNHENTETREEQDPNIVCGSCKCNRCCCITTTVVAAVSAATCGFFAFPAVKLATVGIAAAKTALIEEINIAGAAASLLGTVVAAGWCINGCIASSCNCCTDAPAQRRMGC